MTNDKSFVTYNLINNVTNHTKSQSQNKICGSQNHTFYHFKLSILSITIIQIIGHDFIPSHSILSSLAPSKHLCHLTTTTCTNNHHCYLLKSTITSTMQPPLPLTPTSYKHVQPSPQCYNHIIPPPTPTFKQEIMDHIM